MNVPWQCKITLVKKFRYDGYDSENCESEEDSRPLGPWTEFPPSEESFQTLYSKEEVPEAIKWAQLALLNPSQDWHRYVPGSNSRTPETHEVGFSPNFVRLDLSDKSQQNLSFYDLPGVINLSEKEPYAARLVKELVRRYSKGENSIIILGLPLSNDIVNSSAADIVAQMGAKGRTFGEPRS